MTEIVKEVTLVAIRSGEYTVYVFKVLDAPEYIMCTRLPNWQSPNININDVGYLQYQIVRAGESYTSAFGQTLPYKYSNIYFINFVNRSNISKQELIL